MNNKQLRELLSSFPDDLEVFIAGQESGLELLDNVSCQAVCLNVNSKEDTQFGDLGEHDFLHNVTSCESAVRGIIFDRGSLV